MNKSITILDKDYIQWVKNLVKQYRQSQIKAAIKVNEEQLRFNWLLGHDIVEMKVEERWGEGVVEQLSKDLKKEMPQVEGLSATNLRYCRHFYMLYSQVFAFYPQVGGELPASENSQQFDDIFKIPRGHHKLILDKVKGDINKALFFVSQTIENGWSRALLFNWIDTGLYERSGKAITNFKTTIPETISDLAQELTKLYA